MKNRIGIILLAIGVLAGCFGGSGKAPYIRQYVLEYPPPQGSGSRVDAAVRVERFGADRAYLGQAMLYRQGPFLRESYPLQRWRVSPADMVTECLRRDLRGAALFRAVLGQKDAEEVRYTLTGGVEEFLETGEGAGRRALLAATVTLLDDARKETAGRVVFQKTYRVEAPLVGDGGAAMAAAMSAAMAELSKRVVADIAAALK